MTKDDLYDYDKFYGDGFDDRFPEEEEEEVEDDDEEDDEDRPLTERRPQKRGVTTLAKVGIVVAALLIVMAVVCSVFYMSRLAMKFEGTTVEYVIDDDTGKLKEVVVKGYLVHAGFAQGDLKDAYFQCNAEFLEKNYKEPVTDGLSSGTVKTIKSGDKIAFEVNLGQVKQTARGKKADFKVFHKDMENDSLIVDVSNYYE
jgi:hypothetical protein